jgi:histidinol-phosphatase (PHP family)
LEEYVERLVSLGFREITFTEHAPLPEGFNDPTPEKDSGMKFADLENYFSDVESIKKKYKSRIIINTGLEVDFIEGFEEKTKEFLNEWGKRLDDAILSVHFLKNRQTYDCLDYSPDTFEKMIGQYGAVEKVYEKYYATLLKSVLCDLGPFKPKRIGHITLVRKFQRKFPCSYEFNKDILQILQAIKEKGYELDYNGAGTAKPLCKEPYPPLWVAEEAKSLGIPLIYGSDAHQVKDLNQGIKEMLL